MPKKKTKTLRNLIQDSRHDFSCTWRLAKVSSAARMGIFTVQALQILVQPPDVSVVDITDIGHQIGHVATTVAHLLADIVVTKDGVDLAQHAGPVGVDEDDPDVVLLG